VETVKLSMAQLVPLMMLQLENGGQASLIVTGSSMHPTYRDQKTRVRLEKPAFPLKGHPVILYKRDNGDYILHRIVRKRKDGFLCAGDNQWQKEPVRQDQILARVTGVAKYGEENYVNQRSCSPGLWLWTVLLPMRRPVLALRRKLGRLRRNKRRKQP